MACTTDPKIKWHLTGLVPTTNLLGWWQYESGVSGNRVVYDYSTGGRTLAAGATNQPALQTGLFNGQAGWYFNGTNTVPLQSLVSFPTAPKYLITVAAAEASAFVDYRGLIGPVASGSDILASNNSGTKFVDFTYSGYTYKKNTTSYTAADQQAPMSGVPAILETAITSGFSLDGFQVGLQRNLAGRIWKGWWYETLAYSAEPTGDTLQRLLLYMNLKYGFRSYGVPLYFPSDNLLDIKRSRFYAEPGDYAQITDSYEFQDGSRTFNEVANCPPRRWEYEYENVSPQQVPIFDEFYNQARLVNTFNFTDKYGTTWPNVRIESYDRSHDAHKSWMNSVRFRLIQYPY